MTKVEVRLDGETSDLRPRRVVPHRRARPLDIGDRTFSRLEFVVAGDNVGQRRRYDGPSEVGFAEVRVDGVHVDEVVRLPSDLAAAGAGTADSAPTSCSTASGRTRSSTAGATRSCRWRGLRPAHGPAFTLAGDARLSAYADEPCSTQLLGIPGADDGGVTARRRPTSRACCRPCLLGHRRRSDDGVADAVRRAQRHRRWIQVEAPAPVTVDHLDLQVVADGRHSVPTRLRIEGEDGESRVVEVPAVDDADQPGATASVPISFEPLTTSRLRVTVEDARRVLSNEYYSEVPIVRPVGIAELGIPGVRAGGHAGALPETCRDDLLEVDGRPVGLRLQGPRNRR